MKILMIGGNGFLGKHIQEKLVGHEVWAPPRKNVDWRTGRGIATLNYFKADVVIHLLAIYGGLPFCMANRVRMGIENLEINAHVYRFLERNQPKKIITIGSGCEYPGYKTGALTEEHLGSGVLHKSVDHYGYTKLMQWKICEALKEEFGIGYEHVVLANMYGPGDIFDEERSHVVGGVIYKFVQAMKKKEPVQLLGTGRAVRDLIYVKDVAEMVVNLVNRQDSTNQPLNCSTGKGTSIRELVETVTKHLDFPYEVRWGDESQDGALIKYLDSSKTESVLSWSPTTDLDSGVKETIDWYLNHVSST